MFGMMRTYKGFRLAIEALRRCKDRSIRLIVAGEPFGGFSPDWLTEVASVDTWISVHVGRCTAWDVSLMFGAADVSLFCYEGILSSGTIALAQSFGSVVVAPRLGCIEEAVPPGTGILYDPSGGAEAIRAAVAQSMAVDRAAMGQRASAHMKQFPPEKFAGRLREIYQAVLAG
jgi:glycosyltransferase involved in cell wall biosynthesis